MDKKKGTKPEQVNSDDGQRPVYGKKKITISVMKKVIINLNRMGLETVFGKPMHDYREGKLTGWASPEEMLKVKVHAASGLIKIEKIELE